MNRLSNERHVAQALALLAGLVLALTARPSSAADPVDDETIHGEPDCPLVFGDGAVRAANHEGWADAIDAVWSLDSSVAVLHTRHWRAADPLRFDGIEVLGRDQQGDAVRVLLRVGDEFGGEDCVPGLYSVGVDAALGADGRVIAISKRVVLVAWRGELRYLISDAEQVIDVQVIWGSPWLVPRPAQPQRTTTRSRGSSRPRSRPGRGGRRR